jgi:hypothetical protein
MQSTCFLRSIHLYHPVIHISTCIIVILSLHLAYIFINDEPNETVSQRDTVRSRVAQFGRVASSFAFQPFTHPLTRLCAFTYSLTLHNCAHYACHSLHHHSLSHEQLWYHRRYVLQHLCSDYRHPCNLQPSPILVSSLRAQGQSRSGLYAGRVDRESQTWC